MNLKTFLTKYLTKQQRDTANRLSKQWRKITDSDDYAGDDDEYYLREKLSDLIHPAVKRYAKDIFRKGEPTEDEQYTNTYKGDEVDIILEKWDEGWIASVRTSFWDAPASTIDSDCAVPTATDAFVWGFGDSLTYHILNKGA